MVFFRVIQHLLPNSRAWRITVQKTLRSFFEGLSSAPADVRTFADGVWSDIFPDTTRELAEWEREFGIQPSADATENERRLQLAGEWRATGGQSPSYIQGVLQAAGYPVYVHEWWASTDPYVARDPRDYTNQPVIGSHQCTGYDGFGDPLDGQPQCTGYHPVTGLPLAGQPQCNRFLANETYYIVNKDLTQNAPPPIPDAPAFWPYFLYIAGETFPDVATISGARRSDFERLLLKICPTQQWLVVLVTYATGVFDDTFSAEFE